MNYTTPIIIQTVVTAVTRFWIVETTQCPYKCRDWQS